ncbi:benzoylformate decarboxylase [Rhodococcus qingshengii]|uniref:benzoylformate decarboxylase n=1 Tax=Rhodococcus qingshengii TaxID=334542 RepID=UPI001BE8F07E|nr:benzoylformate decarboxylase [Rhodococcus qingshengii]MBT2269959.1 benzoylformate decarboxylase [Rhodococcus qingshengii]
MTTVREITFELLRLHGLTTIFGNPGSNELPFLGGMPDDFRYILGLHEGAVLAMADGYAQARDEAVLVNLHAAAGTGNAMGVLANSVYTHSPLIIMAGQQVRSTVGQETFLSIVEPEALTRPLVKWSSQPACAEDVPRAISEAIHIASLPAKGPVFIAVPYDDWSAEASDESEHLLQRSTSAGGCLGTEQMRALVSAIDAASSPVIVLGPDVDADNANGDAVRLSEALEAPVWLAPSPPRLPFPTRHPSFRGPLPASIRGVSDLLDGHDLILVIGGPVFRYHQYEPGAYLPIGARLIHVTSDPGEAARAPMGQAYVASVADTVKRLADSVARRNGPPLPPLAEFARPAVSTDLIEPAEVFARLRSSAPVDAVWVNESTSTGSQWWEQLDAREQGSMFIAAGGGLGFGLPAAVGAQLAHPDRQVVGIIGDGSANYGITALWTAAHYNIPVIIVLMKNGTYGALRWFADVLEVEKVPPMDVCDIDFVSIARGYGVEAVAVKTIDDFSAAFEAALAAGVPTLIEVPTALTI